MSFEQSWQIKYFTWSVHVVFLILYVHRPGQASDSVFDRSCHAPDSVFALVRSCHTSFCMFTDQVRLYFILYVD